MTPITEMKMTLKEIRVGGREVDRSLLLHMSLGDVYKTFLWNLMGNRILNSRVVFFNLSRPKDQHLFRGLAVRTKKAYLGFSNFLHLQTSTGSSGS